MARWKCRTQKIAKNCHLRTIEQLCRAISSQLKQLLQLKQNNAKQFQNKTKTFVLGLFQRFVHVKQNVETKQK